MGFPNKFRLQFLVFSCLFTIRFLSCAQFCASDGSDEPPITDPNYMCNEVNFSQINHPPKLYNLSDEYVSNPFSGPIHFCDMVFLLDLDKTLTSEENYSQVIQFISDAMTTCMNRGIGYKILAWPMFNDTQETVCCEQSICYQLFGFMNYRDYVGQYDTLDPIQPVTSKFNFSYTLIDDMKRIGTPQSACLYNNYVLITNRLFNISDDQDVIDELDIIAKVGCITFTIIAVGNNEIDTRMMFDAYHAISLDTFVVPNFNCLDNLKDCIKPCGIRGSQECYNQELNECALPTSTEPPTTTTTITTPKPTPNPDFFNDWQIFYLFAISNRTTQNQFNNLVKYISDPLKECGSTKMVIRFLARNDSDSDWITDMDKAGPYLKQLKYDEVLISGNDQFLNGNDNVTVELVLKAVSIPVSYNEDGSVHPPRITLLTDFVSQPFINVFTTDLLPDLEYYDFNIICFTEESYDGYKAQLKLKAFQLTSDAGYGDSKELRLCQEKSDVTTIMFIIIGCCSGAMLLLILITVLYRQKYMWMRKLKRFKSSHPENVDDLDIIDYWELSRDRLVVKNEKLGNGAYGHVFKGKIVGIPPAIQKYNRSEMDAFIDCDCAVKMMPTYATEAAKNEFKHEIDLMKQIGFNEHIVNMLGCVTTSNKSCLVLEYCSQRDLLKYVKKKKSDLEISRNIDEDYDTHKEFLNFSWQISQGMRFLVEKKIIHRDLAARNILITEFAGIKSAKVSDFGLALTISQTSDGETGGSDRLPIKWLALESLEKREFSHKSDVWSFGIVLFEMYSYGLVPFADVEPNQLIEHLKSGNRPKAPLLTTDKVTEIMDKCWDEKPMMRPDFDELASMFATQLEQISKKRKMRSNYLMDIGEVLRVAENSTDIVKNLAFSQIALINKVNELTETVSKLSAKLKEPSEAECYLDISDPGESIFQLPNGQFYDILDYIDDDLVEICRGKSLKEITSEVVRCVYKEIVFIEGHNVVAMTAICNKKSSDVIYVNVGSEVLEFFTDFILRNIRGHDEFNARTSVYTAVRQATFEFLGECREIMRKTENGQEKNRCMLGSIIVAAEGYGYLELVRTNDYRVLPPEMVKKPDETKPGTSLSDSRNRSLTMKTRKKDSVNLGRDYSFTMNENEKEPEGVPRLPSDVAPAEKEKNNKRKSYLNLIPNLNAINPFSKENDLKKTIKKKFYSRRGSVPY